VNHEPARDLAANEKGMTAMPIVVRDNRKAFTPAPEGLHQAVCVDVVDLGLVEGPWGAKPTVEVRWELDLKHEETGGPFLVSKRFTLTLNEKGNLRPMLEAWRGRKFSPPELEGFDLEKLFGVNCQLQLVHVLTERGGVFANVQAVVPLGKGMTKLRPSEGYVRVIDRDKAPVNGEDGHGDDSVPF
jgi:hypothetical protein